MQIWGRVPCLGPSKWVVWNHLNGKLHWFTGLIIQKVYNPIRFPVMKWIGRFAQRKIARRPSGNCRKLILEASMLMPNTGYVLPHGCFGVLTSTTRWPLARVLTGLSAAAFEGKFGQLIDGTYTYTFGLSRCWCRWGEASHDVVFATCASWCWVVLGDEGNKESLVFLLNDEWRSKLFWGMSFAATLSHQ